MKQCPFLCLMRRNFCASVMVNLAVVFIVLIVLIVTHWRSVAMFFSLINVVQILYHQIKIDQAFVVAFSRHHLCLVFLLSKIYQFFRAKHTWLFETFKRLITPIEMWWMKTQHIKQGDFRRVSNSANSSCGALLIRLLYKTRLKLSIVICCVLISHTEN